MGLGAEGVSAVRLDRLQLGQPFRGGREDALVGAEHPCLPAEAGVGERRLDHVAALEGAVVGERGLVLGKAGQRHLVQLGAADLEALGSVLRRVDHGVLRERIVAEVVERPFLGQAVAARRAGVRVVHDGAVGHAVGAHHQGAAGAALGDFRRRHLQRPRAGGAGLLHRRAGHVFQAEQAGQPGQAVEAARLRIGDAEDAEIDLLPGNALVFEEPVADRGGQPDAVQVGQRALPPGEGRGPVAAVGNECVCHDAYTFLSACHWAKLEPALASFSSSGAGCQYCGSRVFWNSMILS
jgi:hypothetical protein